MNKLTPAGADQPRGFRKLLRDVHRDERGQVSIENILIIAAIALPILIFLIKWGIPGIIRLWNKWMGELEDGGDLGG